MKSKRKIYLSIETAVGGGSISIIEDEVEIDFWAGTNENLRAEDFLEEISKILNKNKIERKSIKLITVSGGPGSSTGIKIGLATARGLGTALNCEVIAVSLLEAILKFVNIEGNCKVCIILPIGKNLFLLEKVDLVNFKASKIFGKAKVFTIEKLIEELKDLSNIKIIVHRKFLEGYDNLLSKSIDMSNQLIVFNENMASIINKNNIYQY